MVPDKLLSDYHKIKFLDISINKYFDLKGINYSKGSYAIGFSPEIDTLAGYKVSLTSEQYKAKIYYIFSLNQFLVISPPFDNNPAFFNEADSLSEENSSALPALY